MSAFIIFGLIIIGLLLVGYFLKKPSTNPSDNKNESIKESYYERNIEQSREGKVKVFNKVDVKVTKVPNESNLLIEPSNYLKGKTEINVSIESINDKNGNVKILAKKRVKPSEEWVEESYDVIMGAS